MNSKINVSLKGIFKVWSLKQWCLVTITLTVGIFLVYLSANLIFSSKLKYWLKIVGVIATTIFIILVQYSVFDIIFLKNLNQINEEYEDKMEALNELKEDFMAEESEKNLDLIHTELDLLKKQISDLQNKIKN